MLFCARNPPRDFLSWVKTWVTDGAKMEAQMREKGSAKNIELVNLWCGADGGVLQQMHPPAPSDVGGIYKQNELTNVK